MSSEKNYVQTLLTPAKLNPRGKRGAEDNLDDNPFKVLKEQEAPSVNMDLNKPTKVMSARLPPIVLGQSLLNEKSTLAKIRTWVPSSHFKLVNKSHAIMTQNLEDYKLVQERLKEAQIQYFTYTPQVDKHKRLVLKGVHEMYTLEEIKTDLLQQSDSVVNVTQMKTYKKSDPKLLNIYLISLKWNTDLATFKKVVRYCCGYSIKFEEYRKPKHFHGSQCFRCQKWGHISRNCNLEQKCVKCSLNHPQGECKMTEADEPKCANCNLKHPANYRGCQTSKAYQKVIRKGSNHLPPVNVNKQQSKWVSAGPTFSSQVQRWSTKKIQPGREPSPRNRQVGMPKKNLVQVQKSNQASAVDFSTFENEIQKLFNVNFLDLMTKINEFWKKYSSIQNETEKKIAMLTFLATITSISNV